MRRYEALGRIIASVDTDDISLSELLTGHGYVFASADHTIEAIAAGAEDARLLGLRAGTPLLRAKRRTVDPAGTPLEWTDDRYRGDALAFSINNSAVANNVDRMAISGGRRREGASG